MVAHSSEFENIVVREEEQNELESLARTSCPLEVRGGPSNKYGKISILIQVISAQRLILCSTKTSSLNKQRNKGHYVLSDMLAM